MKQKLKEKFKMETEYSSTGMRKSPGRDEMENVFFFSNRATWWVSSHISDEMNFIFEMWLCYQKTSNLEWKDQAFSKRILLISGPSAAFLAKISSQSDQTELCL